MTDRRAILTLVLILVAVSAIAAGVAIAMLYRAGFEEQRARLVEFARSQARFIEAVARFDAVHSADDHPKGAAGATLSQVIDAHDHYEGLRGTVEFVLARRDGNDIRFLLRQRHGVHDVPDPIPFAGHRAEPMRQALSGRSGSMTGLDYHGQRVLAAYEPVAGLNWGAVVKIDLAELRGPFLRAGLITVGVVLAVVLAGAILFVRISAPLVHRLEDSEARNRAILASAADGIFTVDDRGNIASFNQAAERIFGYSAAEVIGQSLARLTADERHRDFPALLARFEQLAGEAGLLRREVVGRRRDGSPVPLDLALSRVESARQSAITAIVRDITERKRAAALLRDAHVRLEKRVAERTTELAEANRQLRLEIDVRRRTEEALKLEDARLEALVRLGELAEAPLERIAGFALDQAIRLTRSELGLLGFLSDDESVMKLYSWTGSAMQQSPVDWPPKSLAVAEAGVWAEAVRRRGPVLINDFDSESGKRETPPGQAPLRRFLGLPVFDGSRIVAVASVANKPQDYQLDDVRQVNLLLAGMWRLLQRQRAQVSLRDSEERYRTVAEFSTDCAYWRAPDGTLRYISPNCLDLCGHTPEEFYRSPELFLEIVHPEDRPLWEQHLAIADGDGCPEPLEFRIQARDGTVRWVGHRCRPVYDEGGRFLGVRGANRDITQKRADEEKLRASLTDKEVLLREVHHRVKNNLQVIVSLLRMQSQYLADTRSRQLFRDSESRVRSMALIHEKLYRSSDLAQIDAGDYIRSLARDVVSSFGASAPPVELEVSVDDIVLDMDSAIPCGLVINELLSNALRHAFPGGRPGRVVISLRKNDTGGHELVFRDDGIGLPPEVDLEQSLSLGLPLVATLAEQLQGTLEVNRQAGTEYRIRFTPPSPKPPAAAPMASD